MRRKGCSMSKLFFIPIIASALLFFWLLWRGRKIQAVRCGHMTRIKDLVTAFGRTITTTVPVENGKTEYCHKCLEKMAIRCAWCGNPIFIGNPVTLYSPNDSQRQMPDYSVLYDKELNSYVGCLNWECAETGADRAGFWYPPGKVVRVLSPIELSMRSLKQGGDGVIMVNDLSRP